MLVVYSGEGEIIVCNPLEEAETIHDYFVMGGRDIEDYDREETNEAVCVGSEVKRKF
jgi:hypothetical protein